MKEIIEQINQAIEKVDIIAAVVCYDCELVFDECNKEDKCVGCGERYNPEDREICPNCGSDEYDMLCPECKSDNIEYLDSIVWDNWKQGTISSTGQALGNGSPSQNLTF